MRKQLLCAFLCFIFLCGLTLVSIPSTVSGDTETNQGITRIQSINGGAALHGTDQVDNATNLQMSNYADNRASATLTRTPIEGNVLIAVVGVETLVSSQFYAVNVSSITQNGVTWTRQVNQFYRGWYGDVEIWLGVVGANADKSITFTVNVDPPEATYTIISYAVCEYSGVATVLPLDQTAVSHNTAETTTTGETALTNADSELWIGAVFIESSVSQTEGLNGFSLVGGTTEGTDGRISTALLERVVDEKGTAWSGTEISAENTLVGYLGCIATFYSSNHNPDETANPTENPTASATPSPTDGNRTTEGDNGAQLQFNCQSATSSTIRVNIQGSLTADGNGIANEPILFSYSVTNGASWTDLTMVSTDNSGDFTVVWNPTVTGNYLVRAVWAGNQEFSETITTVNFAITPIESQQESFFSINSNSTISTLNFDSTTKQLSFTVNGVTGTTGYVQVYVPKTLMSDVSGLTVNLDDSAIDYAYEDQDDMWFVTFTYHHSTHQVTMNISSSGNAISIWILGAAIVIPLVAAVGAGVMVVIKRVRT